MLGLFFTETLSQQRMNLNGEQDLMLWMKFYEIWFSTSNLAIICYGGVKCLNAEKFSDYFSFRFQKEFGVCLC